MQYKAIGFDYSGVIYGMPGSVYMQNLEEFLGVPVEEINRVYFQHNHKVNVGNASMEDVWRAVAKDLGKDEKQLLRFTREAENQKEVSQEILQLMQALREKGYKVGIFSNYDQRLRAILDKQGVTPFADVVAVSGEMGYMKPHPQAFRMFCEMLAVSPQELVFIDDTKKSLENAGEVGFTPILYENYESLLGRLREMGIL